MAFETDPGKLHQSETGKGVNDTRWPGPGGPAAGTDTSSTLRNLSGRAILAAMQEIVAIKDTCGVYRAVNPAMCRFLGKPEAIILGRTDFDLFPPDLAAAYQALDAQVMESLAPRNIEEQAKGSGQPIWVSTTKSPLLDQENRCSGVLVVVRDITARKLAEENAKRRILFQRILVNVAATCINIPLDEVDAAIHGCLEEMGRFVDADRAYIFEFHFDRGIAVNTHEWCAEGIPAQIQNLRELPLDQIGEGLAELTRGRPHHVEDVTALPPGPLRSTLEPQGIRSLMTVPLLRGEQCIGCVGFDSVRQARPFCDDEYTLLAMFARMLVNIGLRREVEESLRLAGLKAQAASDAKSEFLANMSHEIRTPLNGILGMLQLMNTTSLDAEQSEYIHMATQAARRMTRLLSDILDLSRVEAGKLTLQEAPFSMSEVRRSVLDIFKPVSSRRDVRTSFELDPLLPDRLVGDETRLRQILLNLVGNSLKFTERGFVRVEASLLGSDAGNRLNVAFRVCDSGCGIPEDKLGLIFEPFEQLTQACNRGVGLGLAIVRRLVELMGGRIEARSRPGEGTAVTVTLPFGLADEQEDAPALPTGAEKRSGHRILLVEDDLFNQKTSKALLEKSGYAVSEVDTGLEALHVLQESDFDCILMDIHLPGLDGVETARIIRNAPEFRAHAETPIIAVTANAMLGDRERFLAAGMNDFIAKPMDFHALTAAIENATGSRRVPR
ncbi:ATP-binding protein [Desulfomicrobium escambiense]|uniref:ATP-binding protein n=1 Tax=Desulfomicrobium escambiense TaxID=29503 RepID=UPI00040AB436|nr:ATP-binding protein [Desulfomicrobium escambiense]